MISGRGGHPLSTKEKSMGLAIHSTLKIGDKCGGGGHPVSKQLIAPYSPLENYGSIV